LTPLFDFAVSYFLDVPLTFDSFLDPLFKLIFIGAPDISEVLDFDIFDTFEVYRLSFLGGAYFFGPGLNLSHIF